MKKNKAISKKTDKYNEANKKAQNEKKSQRNKLSRKKREKHCREAKKSQRSTNFCPPLNLSPDFHSFFANENEAEKISQKNKNDQKKCSRILFDKICKKQTKKKKTDKERKNRKTL